MQPCSPETKFFGEPGDVQELAHRFARRTYHEGPSARLVALVGGGLALINISIDQVSNPKLKTGSFLKRWRRLNAEVQARRAGASS